MCEAQGAWYSATHLIFSWPRGHRSAWSLGLGETHESDEKVGVADPLLSSHVCSHDPWKAPSFQGCIGYVR